MATGQVQILQSPVQPTVIVASTSSPTRYKSYSSRVNITLGIIQILCGIFLMGLNVSKKQHEYLKFAYKIESIFWIFYVTMWNFYFWICLDRIDSSGFARWSRFWWNMVWTNCKFYHHRYCCHWGWGNFRIMYRKSWYQWKRNFWNKCGILIRLYTLVRDDTWCHFISIKVTF